MEAGFSFWRVTSAPGVCRRKPTIPRAGASPRAALPCRCSGARDRGPYAADFQQLPERAPLRVGSEAVEKMRILAHHEVREQCHALTGRRPVVEGAHRHLDFVAD